METISQYLKLIKLKNNNSVKYETIMRRHNHIDFLVETNAVDASVKCSTETRINLSNSNFLLKINLQGF